MRTPFDIMAIMRLMMRCTWSVGMQYPQTERAYGRGTNVY